MNYTINEYDLNELGASGMGRITARVKGYWSSDPITAYFNRNMYGQKDGWKVTLSHSSGGRDNKEVESDIDASRNFALAMIALAEEAERIITTQQDVLEAAYQKRREEYRIREEQEQAAKQRAIDEDTPLGKVEAELMVNEIAAKAGDTYYDALRASVFRRSKFSEIHVYATRGIKKVTFRLAGRRIAKADLIAELANCSSRSKIIYKSNKV